MPWLVRISDISFHWQNCCQFQRFHSYSGSHLQHCRCGSLHLRPAWFEARGPRRSLARWWIRRWNPGNHVGNILYNILAKLCKTYVFGESFCTCGFDMYSWYNGLLRKCHAIHHWYAIVCFGDIHRQISKIDTVGTLSVSYSRYFCSSCFILFWCSTVVAVGFLSAVWEPTPPVILRPLLQDCRTSWWGVEFCVTPTARELWLSWWTLPGERDLRKTFLQCTWTCRTWHADWESGKKHVEGVCNICNWIWVGRLLSTFYIFLQCFWWP